MSTALTSVTAAPGSSFPTAELDRRFYAFTIDRLLALVLYGAAVWAAWVLLLDDEMVLAGIALIVGVVVLVSIVQAFVLGLLGTSVGKAAVGLRVVDEETGSPIGVGSALLRALVVGLAALPVGMGLAMLAWTAVMDVDRKRRGWHDHLAGSVVIDVRPALVEEEDAPERPRNIVNLTAMRLVPASPTPPREVPARVRRSRWATGPAGAEAPAAPAVPAAITTAAPAPVPLGPVVPDPASAPPAEAPPAPAPVVAPPAEAPPVPAPVVAPPVAVPPAEPAPAPDPDALSTPPGVAPAARRTGPAADPLSDPLSDSLAQPAPAPARSAPRHAAAAGAGAPAAARTGRPVWSVAFDTGETFTVEGFTLVGRNPEPRQGEPVKRLVALPSQDMSLSKTHAQFQVVPDGALVVMDRGSTNGSILIRGGVPKELGPGRPAALRDGDRVRFGDREMRVVREA